MPYWKKIVNRGRGELIWFNHSLSFKSTESLPYLYLYTKISCSKKVGDIGSRGWEIVHMNVVKEKRDVTRRSRLHLGKWVLGSWDGDIGGGAMLYVVVGGVTEKRRNAGGGGSYRSEEKKNRSKNVNRQFKWLRLKVCSIKRHDCKSKSSYSLT